MNPPLDGRGTEAWRRLGRVIEPPDHLPWASTHACVPVIDPALTDPISVYFSPRDSSGRSHIARATLRVSGEGAEARFDERPVLGPGPSGAFDGDGAMASCLVRDDGRAFLYYIGWQRSVTVPFHTFIGLATSDDDCETFVRFSPAPIVDRDTHDPFLTTSPWVIVENGVWRMWYTSGVRWEVREGRPFHLYNIRYAESTDGIAWRRDGRVCIDFEAAGEYALARPCVKVDGDRYRMWFSVRGDRYEIGYAESRDGLTWLRSDRTCLRPSNAGFDSEMVEYPCVFDLEERRFMLYNGDGYGETGIGLAVLEGRAPSPLGAR